MVHFMTLSSFSNVQREHDHSLGLEADAEGAGGMDAGGLLRGGEAACDGAGPPAAARFAGAGGLAPGTGRGVPHAAQAVV